MRDDDDLIRSRLGQKPDQHHDTNHGVILRHVHVVAVVGSLPPSLS